MSDVGNYKGVMLCNRPGAKPEKSSQRFVSRVKGYDPLGLPRHLQHINKNLQPKPKQVLNQHKQWLSCLQKNRKEQEDNATKKAKAQTEAFKRRHSKRQAQLLKRRAASVKPKWALSQEQAEAQEVAETAAEQQRESNEVEELLEFFANIDYDELMDDFEFKLALEVLKRKIDSPAALSPVKAPRRPRSVCSWRPKLAESVESSEKPEVTPLIPLIVEDILKDHPKLKQIHSKASIKALLEQCIARSLVNHPNLYLLRAAR